MDTASEREFVIAIKVKNQARSYTCNSKRKTKQNKNVAWWLASAVPVLKRANRQLLNNGACWASPKPVRDPVSKTKN